MLNTADVVQPHMRLDVTVSGSSRIEELIFRLSSKMFFEGAFIFLPNGGINDF